MCRSPRYHAPTPHPLGRLSTWIALARTTIIGCPRQSGWAGTPEESVLSRETHAYVQRVIAALPLSQRAVITLRDMGGWTADEVCPALAITAANQRVLLHRARSTVRRALERYFDQR